MMNIYSKMFQKIKDKGYRNRFIEGQIKTGIPFQVRALRAARKLTQKQLGEEAKIPQTVVSRIENGSGGSLSIKTLLRLAEAFDVALVVRFEPIDKLINWVDDLSPEVLSFKPSEEILADIEREAVEREAVIENPPAASNTKGALLRPVQAKLTPMVFQPALSESRAVLRGLPTKTSIHKSGTQGRIGGQVVKAVSTEGKTAAGGR